MLTALLLLCSFCNVFMCPVQEDAPCLWNEGISWYSCYSCLMKLSQSDNSSLFSTAQLPFSCACAHSQKTWSTRRKAVFKQRGMLFDRADDFGAEDCGRKTSTHNKSDLLNESSAVHKGSRCGGKLLLYFWLPLNGTFIFLKIKISIFFFFKNLFKSMSGVPRSEQTVVKSTVASNTLLLNEENLPQLYDYCRFASMWRLPSPSLLRYRAEHETSI